MPALSLCFLPLFLYILLSLLFWKGHHSLFCCCVCQLFPPCLHTLTPSFSSLLFSLNPASPPLLSWPSNLLSFFSSVLIPCPSSSSSILFFYLFSLPCIGVVYASLVTSFSAFFFNISSQFAVSKGYHCFCVVYDARLVTSISTFFFLPFSFSTWQGRRCCCVCQISLLIFYFYFFYLLL